MITLKEFNEKDLCFEYDDQLYDYDTLEDFCENIYKNLIGETDIEEFNIAYQRLLEEVKNKKVYTKEYFKMPADRIKVEIKSFIEDNWDTEIDQFEPYYSDKAEEYLHKFLKEVEEHTQIWRINKIVGCIDFAEELFTKYGEREY
jgi:hypothetical protein